MKTREKGVLPDSRIYFHIPKEHDRRVFLTLGSSGYFYCDENYRVIRNNYAAPLETKFLKHISRLFYKPV
jgi:hypothetical protein